MASQQRPDASPTQGERRITFEDDAVKEKPQQRTSPVPAVFSGASKSSSGSGSGSSGSSWENISMRVFGGRGYLTGSGEDLLEPGPEFIDEKENEEADKEAADEHDAYMHAARAFMSTVLQAKSSKKIMDPLHYDKKIAQILASGVTTGQAQAAFAWRKLRQWRTALLVVGIVDVVLLLALLLGMYDGDLTIFWKKHVRNYGFSISVADIALLILLRGVMNVSLPAALSKQGRTALPLPVIRGFCVFTCLLNLGTFVVMLVKASVLEWDDDDTTSTPHVARAVLAVFLLVGIVDLPILFNLLRAYHLSPFPAEVQTQTQMQTQAQMGPPVLVEGKEEEEEEKEGDQQQEGKEQDPETEAPPLGDTRGETIYTSDVELGDPSFQKVRRDGRGGGKEEKTGKAGKGGKAPAGSSFGLTWQQILLVLQPYFWPSRTSLNWFGNRVRCIASWILIAASKCCTVIAPFFLARAINFLGGKSAADAAAGEAQMEPAKAAMAAVEFCALTFLGIFLQELQSVIYLSVRKVACAEISERTYSHILSLSMGWQLKAKIGKTIRAIDRGMDSVNTIVTYTFLTLIPTLAECLAVCVIFLVHYHQWDVSLLLMVGLWLFGVVTVKITNRRRFYRQLSNQKDTEIHERATDSLVNFETVKAYTNEPYEKFKYKNGVRVFQELDAETDASLSYLTVTQGFILQTFQMGILLLTVHRVVTGNMTVGDFVAINKFTDNAFQPLQVLSTVYNSVSKALIDMQNLNLLLAERPDIKDPVHAPTFSPPSSVSSPPSAIIPASKAAGGKKGGVEVTFENIYFHYPDQDPARGVQNVSFTIKPGTTTAIVGHTGSCKSTLARLLFRFYDPISGAVRFNGEDIRKFKQRSVRKAIGVVPQDTSLFNDSLLNNLRYGCLNATFADVEKAVESAQLRPFIDAQPQGFNLAVGERGLKLSGGEKQRVAIARCILKDAPILLLDESTSALDTKTEKEISDALNRLGSNRTVLVIAHRLSTVRNADQIIVMDKGCMLERGTHDELLALKGQYAKMWELQVNSGEEGKGEGEEKEAGVATH